MGLGLWHDAVQPAAVLPLEPPAIARLCRLFQPSQPAVPVPILDELCPAVG